MTNESIGAMIKARRLELGFSLEAVGKAVGVGRSTVRKWENGMIKNMGRDKIAALAAVLDLNPVKLIQRSTAPKQTFDEILCKSYHEAPEAIQLAVRKLLELEGVE